MFNAQYELGEYFNGEDNYDEAVHWYLLAAKQGHIKAQYALGDCYARCFGVEEDWEQAYHWFYSAAKQGYAEAQFDVAECLATGTGCGRK